jgi:aerobic carbon-monoxide dehydrogenase medium subunit
VKLPPFEYACPGSLEEAAHMLAVSDGNARIIAGGQSLIPMMAFRLAAPGQLIDLRRVPGLRSISVGAQGIHLGAMVRWRDIIEHKQLRSSFPLLHAAITHVAHYQIQNRGTVGGSIAHADPAAEFPGIAVTCDAVIEAVSINGSRQIPAMDLFVGPLQTCLDDNEIITAIRFPRWNPNRRWAFEEFSRRKGDFALAAIMLFYDLADDGRPKDAHIGVVGATDLPRRLPAAESMINGHGLDETTIIAAAEAAASEVNAPGDLHGSPEYRKSLVATLTKRCLRKTLV